jgi:lia operon protein LiaG
MLNKLSIKKLATVLGVIFIASGLISGVIFFMQYAESGFTLDALETYENNVDVKETADLLGIDTIRVETTSSDITLISDDSNEIKAHFYGGYSCSSKSFKPELIVSKDGDKLLVKVNESVNGVMLSFISNLKLDVYIPSQFAESVEVKSASGTVESGELSVKDFSVETSSGDIETDFINAENALFDTNSGEMKIKGRFTGLNAKSTSGDIVSDTVEAATSKFESTSGSIRFNGKFTELSVKSTSGDISSDSVEAATSELESSSGEIAISGNLAAITAMTTSGDIILSSSEKPQTIQIKTNSGETRLKLPDSAGFKLACKSSSGEINSDFPVTVITTNGKYENEHELNGTVGDGSGSVTITSSSGDIRILN